MKTASISYAKAHLSALLGRVRSGHSVIITDRGIPVARLEPVTVAGSDAYFRSLVERGLATSPKVPPTKTLLEELPPSPTLKRGTSLVQAVRDERDEGW
ncbi:MAG TPA: type II toxin-antitoxin system prevent-host-death family antitoxin [Gemmatimonadaceae bacterium]|nr:type II toxin-antitoxin system prevent-host-death family antitoxin [Gemmatimonadaceae bacterium]